MTETEATNATAGVRTGMILIQCEFGHRHGCADAESWRLDRGCRCLRIVRHRGGGFHFERCNAMTIVRYALCPSAHAAWRWPNRIPMDGEVCPDCDQRYVEPYIYETEKQIEYRRARFMIAAILLDEAEGMYNGREARDRIEEICLRHGFPTPREKKPATKQQTATAIAHAYEHFAETVWGISKDDILL